MSRFEQMILQRAGRRARERARGDNEALYREALRVAMIDANERGFSDERVRSIARVFLGEQH